MLDYKRNQLEEAISRVLHPDAAKPSAELRTRIKRLFDLDRERGRSPRSVDPERANYAFFDVDAPGKGVEIAFSGYEAFALLIGLQLLSHGWPQGFVVAVMRRVRQQLEPQHSSILAQNPATLFDTRQILANAQPGDLAFDNVDPVFLVIASGHHNPSKTETADYRVKICRGMEAVGKFVKQQGARSWSVFELATLAHQLSEQLKKAPPRKRGRSR
jgi:hypothetical protein